MSVILKKIIKNEKGAASVVEMTLIFPLVTFVMAILIYVGCYVMQGVMIYNNAQRVAMLAAKEAVMPGYVGLLNGREITIKTDFDSGINGIMNNHNPYRYWGNGFISGDSKGTLEKALRSLITSTSFFVASYVDCEITTSNHILNQDIYVHVTNDNAVPGLFNSFGIDVFYIDVTVTATVSDATEFVRNVDMVFDLKDYMFNELKIGKSNQTINEKIAIFKQKFTDICAKLGVKS